MSGMVKTVGTTQLQNALGTCGSILFTARRSDECSVERLLRHRNLVYSIDNHLEMHGTSLDPVTRALLAASREVISLAARTRTITSPDL